MSPGQGNSSFSHDVGKHPFPGCIFLTSSQGVTVLAGGRGGWGPASEASHLRTYCHGEMHDILTSLPISGDKDSGLWGQ